jgi:hypothetical protein
MGADCWLYALDCVKAFFVVFRSVEDAIVALDVKKLEGLVAGWWNARMGAESRREDLATAGNLVARRAGP